MKYFLIAVTLGSLFIGLLIVSIGGAIHPEMLTISAPFVCHRGEKLTINTLTYSGWLPGHGNVYNVSRGFYCVDGSGKQRYVDFPVFVVSTFIYSFFTFLAIIALTLLMKLKKTKKRH